MTLDELLAEAIVPMSGLERGTFVNTSRRPTR